ncbi:MAG: immunoglobulin domain-containing protein, partial [Planctomycetota bacterium]|nr:immunoglobulin domain-containing protein [Planctomycetota bacterium]
MQYLNHTQRCSGFLSMAWLLPGRAWRMLHVALAIAVATVISSTAQAQVCSTAGGGIIIVDTCCFKEQPRSYTFSCEGSVGSVRLQAEFLGALPNGFLESNVVTWQWEKQAADGTWNAYGAEYQTGGGADLIGYLDITPGQPVYAGNYRCKFNELYNSDRPTYLPCGVKYSATATVVVEERPGALYISTVDQTICPGGTYSLMVNGPVPDSSNSYQWYRNGVAISNGTSYFGATTKELLFSNVNQTHQAAYYCVLNHGSNCPVNRTSNTVNITVQPAGPTLTSVPNFTTTSTCPGTPVSLGPVVATGVDFTYQWYKV